MERSIPAGPAADEAALSSLDGNHVQAALKKLPTEQRRAVAPAYYGGFTQREVASITGVPIGTVKSRMFTATQQLRRQLTPLMPELTALPEKTKPGGVVTNQTLVGSPSLVVAAIAALPG
jgi:RNA polymerase sigma-70 factor (ECF subfamily)